MWQDARGAVAAGAPRDTPDERSEHERGSRPGCRAEPLRTGPAERRDPLLQRDRRPASPRGAAQGGARRDCNAVGGRLRGRRVRRRLLPAARRHGGGRAPLQDRPLLAQLRPPGGRGGGTLVGARRGRRDPRRRSPGPAGARRDLPRALAAGLPGGVLPARGPQGRPPPPPSLRRVLPPLPRVLRRGDAPRRRRLLRHGP